LRTITAGRSGFSGERFRQSGTGFLALVSLAAILLALPGCSGCNKDPAALKAELEKAEAEKKKKEAEKPKDDFDRGNLGTYPTPNRPLSNSCKQGHWTSAVLVDMKANNFDFHGDMDLEMLDGQSHPQPLLATPFELSTSRQISFPKGQAKRFDSVFFVPQNAEKTTAQCKISARGGGRTVAEIPMLLARMPSYQYHLVVLSRIPEQYGYLNKPEARFFSVTPYVKDIDNNLEPYYRVTYLSGEKQPALPKHASLWTSIACIVWDDALPSTFDLDQQRALIDWLHWGGQIVMSGPDTLDSLKGSFLEPYLPATAAGSRDIAAEDLAEIIAFSGKDIRKIVPVKSWSGVKFDKHPQAEYVPRSGDLVVERRVGRGRIVVTAFRLGDRGFKTWPGADEFFSAYLLRHPPRKFREGDEMDDVKALWSDDKKHKDFDAAEITGLRYFARDAEIKLAEYAPDLPKLEEPAREALGFGYGYGRMNPNSVPDESDAIDLTNSGTVRGPGVAAWNDFSPAAGRARDALLSAARIEVPKRMFVVTVLVLYLAFLVPFNYCLFRAMNRVEWAWAAAPVIAIICTAAVIRLAQLDIGFIRSRTEIGVLEIQSDYSRSHLTRYNALYTSLTTPYDFTFADGGAVALPFPKVKEPNLFALVTGEERRNLRYVSGDQAMLQGGFRARRTARAQARRTRRIQARQPHEPQAARRRPDRKAALRQPASRLDRIARSGRGKIGGLAPRVGHRRRRPPVGRIPRKNPALQIEREARRFEPPRDAEFRRTDRRNAARRREAHRLDRRKSSRPDDFPRLRPSPPRRPGRRPPRLRQAARPPTRPKHPPPTPTLEARHRIQRRGIISSFPCSGKGTHCPRGSASPKHRKGKHIILVPTLRVGTQFPDAPASKQCEKT
jgi:hypothetical protein